MEFPTLKFPKPHGKLEARMKYELGLLDPDGFAATYFETLKQAEKEMETVYSYYENEDSWRTDEVDGKVASCTLINKEHMKIREKIDHKMQKYLLSHDGRIDLWPDGSGFRVLCREETKFYFHYFGHRYSETYYNHYDEVRRTGSDLVYRNEYVSSLKPGLDHENRDTAPESPNYKPYKTEEKKAKMEEKAKMGKETVKESHTTCIVAAVAGVLLFLVMVSLLVNRVFGVEGPVTQLIGSDFPELHTFCLVLSALGVWACITQYLNHRDYKRASEKDLQAYEEYLAGPYEQELNAEKEQEARKTEAWNRDNAFAGEWHRAWFEWARQVGDLPEDAEKAES